MFETKRSTKAEDDLDWELIRKGVEEGFLFYEKDARTGLVL